MSGSPGTGDPPSSPARTVYEALGARPVLTLPAYRRLIEELDPLWIEDIVCPVHVAVRHLSAAAAAVAAGATRQARARHEAARTYLYEALSSARLLTLEERSQEVVVSDLLRGAERDGDADTRDVRILDGWGGWRRGAGG